jgi:alpha-mannosidase
VHDSRAQTELRLRRFTAERIEPAVYRSRVPLAVQAWQVPGEPVPFSAADLADYLPLHTGDAWGPPWGTTWLRITGTVPAEWGSDGALPPGLRAEALIDLGFTGDYPGFQAEGLAYTAQGRAIKGVAPRSSQVGLAVAPGAAVDLRVEAASNPKIEGSGVLRYAPTALGDLGTAGSTPLYRLGRVDLGLLDVQVWELLRDIEMLEGLALVLPTDLPRRALIMRSLERMLDALDPDDVAGTAAAGRAELTGALAAPATASAHHLHAVGHAHIDSAWLWPVRETIRKCARTFASVVDLMDTDPDFVFACSSAQQFAWIKEHYPELFARIRDKVSTGQFVPVGGMWVESDTNMPGGEAMARQFLTGKRFFLQEFGVDSPEVWLPDSFGYSAALPQIVAAAGSRYFLTQKISWNQTNRMPHHTFWWQGIDGTRVFTHFPPVDTYNSQLVPSELAHAEHNYADHGDGSMSLVPFGFGDGGGGPTREMLARGHRARSMEGSPTVEFSSPARFFEQAEIDYPDPATWVGEMYLELHRGTYTSQARTKQGNRRSEHLLREAELWATTAAVRLGADYPYERLGKHWRTVLLNQFHDILPGSSIAWVYRVAEAQYAELATDLEQLITDLQALLAGAADPVDRTAREIVFNAAPQERDGVPALGAGARVSDPAGPAVSLERAADTIVLDNGLLRVTLDGRGLITSLMTAGGREVIPAGMAGNLLQLHRDLPNEWDAWDVDLHYLRGGIELDAAQSISIVEQTTQTVTVLVVREFEQSRVTQQITLHRGSGSIELVTDVDWHERQKLLKLAFPIDLQADRSAAETQFGHVFRPTHTNTSWEAAKFEICAHRWIQVAEPGFGVAISNDRTYGHDVRTAAKPGGGTMTTVRLSLLRAPVYPDPGADQGRHVFRSSLVPAADIAAAVRAGYRTNLPVRTITGTRTVQPLVAATEPGVVIEAVKLAEDRSGDVIVRLYESLGQRCATTVTAGFLADGIWTTDLLERTLDGAAPEVSGLSVELNLRPFELVTLRFRRAAGSRRAECT